MSEHSFQRDGYFSSWKWVLGQSLYASDLDWSLTGDGEIVEDIFEEFNSDFQTVAIIDAKRQNKNNLQQVSNRHYAMKYQIYQANFKKIPFFSVLTYLDPSWEGQNSFFVIANNKYAHQFLNQHYPNVKEDKMWFSPATFSKFLHKLHGIFWNANAPIKLEDRWNQNVKLSNQEVFTLDDLPRKVYTHPLPYIEKIDFPPQLKRKLLEIE